MCWTLNELLIDMFYNDIFGDSPIGVHKTKYNFLFDLTTFYLMEHPLKTTINTGWFSIRQDHRTRLITSFNGYWKKQSSVNNGLSILTIDKKWLHGEKSKILHVNKWSWQEDQNLLYFRLQFVIQICLWWLHCCQYLCIYVCTYVGVCACMHGGL